MYHLIQKNKKHIIFFMEVTQSLPELNGRNKEYLQYITAANKVKFCAY